MRTRTSSNAELNCGPEEDSIVGTKRKIASLARRERGATARRQLRSRSLNESNCQEPVKTGTSNNAELDCKHEDISRTNAEAKPCSQLGENGGDSASPTAVSFGSRRTTADSH